MSTTSETRKPKIGDIVFYTPEGEVGNPRPSVRPAIVTEIDTADDTIVFLTFFPPGNGPVPVPVVHYSPTPQRGFYSFESN